MKRSENMKNELLLSNIYLEHINKCKGKIATDIYNLLSAPESINIICKYAEEKMKLTISDKNRHSCATSINNCFVNILTFYGDTYDLKENYSSVGGYLMFFQTMINSEQTHEARSIGCDTIVHIQFTYSSKVMGVHLTILPFDMSNPDSKILTPTDLLNDHEKAAIGF